MEQLFSITVMVEPDFQRLGRLCLEAVQGLNGNGYTATASLDRWLPRLRSDRGTNGGPVDVFVGINAGQLCACWLDKKEPLTPLATEPTAAQVTDLAERLRQASEAADSELLRQRNRQIRADLDAARERAATELAELETALDKKKSELQESMRLAETDGLTRLLNRGGYDDRLRQSFLRCRRQQEPLCLLLLDLDKFKEINDTHGHQYGDEFLKRMADAMRAAVREHVDFPCRMGGDEFAIILFAPVPVAERVADAVLQRMERRVSIGIAQAAPDDSIDTLIARADAALYEAKRQGRGRHATAAGAPVGTAPRHARA